MSLADLLPALVRWYRNDPAACEDFCQRMFPGLLASVKAYAEREA